MVSNCENTRKGNSSISPYFRKQTHYLNLNRRVRHGCFLPAFRLLSLPAARAARHTLHESNQHQTDAFLSNRQLDLSKLLLNTLLAALAGRIQMVCDYSKVLQILFQLQHSGELKAPCESPGAQRDAWPRHCTAKPKELRISTFFLQMLRMLQIQSIQPESQPCL